MNRPWINPLGIAGLVIAAFCAVKPANAQLQVSIVNDAVEQCGSSKMNVVECLATLRKPKTYPLALAVTAMSADIDSTELRVRLTDSGGSFRSMPPDSRDAPEGSVVLWQFHPSSIDALLPSATMDDVRAGIDVRLRVVTKGDGAKGCPIVKFRRPGDRWEYYDSNKKTWEEIPDPNTASFTAVQMLFAPGLTPLACY